jgi:hypothetical protein
MFTCRIKYILLGHTPEQEADFTNRIVKLNIFMAATWCQPKIPAAVAVAL